MELRVGNKYRLGRKIGSGSFGDIFLGAFLLPTCSPSPACRAGRYIFAAANTPSAARACGP